MGACARALRVCLHGDRNSGFSNGRPLDPLPCQSCLNSHDKSFIGGWVADVVLGNPVGDVLMGFMDQEVFGARLQSEMREVLTGDLLRLRPESHIVSRRLTRDRFHDLEVNPDKMIELSSSFAIPTRSI